jgi:hypothetical protein
MTQLQRPLVPLDADQVSRADDLRPERDQVKGSAWVY